VILNRQGDPGDHRLRVDAAHSPHVLRAAFEPLVAGGKRATNASTLLLGVVAGLAGMTAWNFRIALALNGIGWNFLFVGATTLVTTCYRPSERGKAQALNDFLVFGTTATGSFVAGFLQERLGWYPLNWFSLVLLAVAVAAVLWLRLQPPPLPPHAVRAA
jgi:MFS family permease